jgi:hypothetical protein
MQSLELMVSWSVLAVGCGIWPEDLSIQTMGGQLALALGNSLVLHTAGLRLRLQVKHIVGHAKYTLATGFG